MHRADAGFSVGGVAGARATKIQTGGRSKKPRFKKAAFVVFSGIRCGYFETWYVIVPPFFFFLLLNTQFRAEVDPLVTGVPNNLFRGYRTKAEARAALRYAEERFWLRVWNAPLSASAILPQPFLNHTEMNPLNGDEILDDRWFIVYRGISPGVYRSQ